MSPDAAKNWKDMTKKEQQHHVETRVKQRLDEARSYWTWPAGKKCKCGHRIVEG